MKKGFTLIELLAVIIILAIVALIATPIVLDVVSSSKDSAAKSEAAMVLSGINNYCATADMKNQLDGTLNECADGVELDEISNMVDLGNATVNGITFESGTITCLSVNSNGRIINYDGTSYSKSDTVDRCTSVNYGNIYNITSAGIITGLKTQTVTGFNIIERVYADALTEEALEYIADKKITIPESVNNIEVNGIGENAFYNYDIEEVTILSNKALSLGTNALPQNMTKLKVKSCWASRYATYSGILENIEVMNCPPKPLIKVYNANNDCIAVGNTCTLDQIRSTNGVALDVTVKDGAAPTIYTFHVIADDGNKLTLLMNQSLFKSKWSNESSTSSGPTAVLPALEEATADWDDLLTMEYSLNSNLENNIHNTASAGSNTSGWMYNYATDPIAAKARLITFKELQSVCNITSWCTSCNRTNGWLTSGSAWTSSARGTTEAWSFQATASGTIFLNSFYPASNECSVVPVIELNKANMQIIESE